MIYIIYILIGLVLYWIVAGLISGIRFLLKKNYPAGSFWIGCGIFPILLICIIGFAFFHTPDSLIEDLFTTITAESLPASAKIIEKESTSSWLDHSTAGLIRMDTADFNRIYKIVSTDSVFRKDTTDDTTWNSHGHGRELLRKAKIPNTGFEKYRLGSKRRIGFCWNKRYIIIEDIDY